MLFVLPFMAMGVSSAYGRFMNDTVVQLFGHNTFVLVSEGK
jgi:hypothetical protein